MAVRHRPGPLNQRTVRPQAGGAATLTRLAKLRAERAMAEARFMQHPSHAHALAFALVLQQMSTEVMKVVGVEVTSELEELLDV